MAERISALQGHYQPDVSGKPGNPGVKLQEIKDLSLHQVAAWPETLAQVGAHLQQQLDSPSIAGPGQVQTGNNGTMLRVEPLKWWLLDSSLPQIDSAQAVVLDLSHARSRLRISGPQATALLNLHLPLDLRETQFPETSVASSMIHHVGVTLWRHAESYDLFIPRGFALSIWQGLVDSAQQFGLEII